MRNSDIETAYKILESYQGDNNQILYCQFKVDNSAYSLSDFEVTYIINNYEYKSFFVNKIVLISSEYGDKLTKKYDLEFVPNKVYITKVIGEMGDSYHCFLQYRQSVPPALMYINKKYLLTNIKSVDNEDNIEIDFDYYDNITKSLGRKLKEGQKEGVSFLVKNKKCILADSMGTGKTTQSIVASMATGSKKILIICPASLKSNWKKEISIYNDPDDITIINGNNWECNTRFTIVNYDIIDNFYKVPTELVYENGFDENGNFIKVPKMVKSSGGKMVQKTRKTINKAIIKECLNNSPMFLEKFDCVILDEAHKLSNNTSIRYKTISDYLKRSEPKYIFLLTGTPLTNKPSNLYNILKLIDAEVTKDYYYYMTRYCGAKKIRLKTGKEILTTPGATNLNELKEKIKHIYIRRLLHEMTDMVNKDVITKYYDLNDKQKQEYNKLWDDYLISQQEKGNEDNEDYRELVEGMLVRQYLAKEMTSNTIELVDEKLECGEKVIIICTFKEEIDILKKYYGKKAVVYDGKMTTKQKDKAEHDFMNNPKITVFIGQIIACSVGLTLTAAYTLIFNSYSWVAADNLQAQDRIYRLNQTHDVTCIYQLFNDSISQNMFEKVMKKEVIMDETIKSEQNK